MASDDDGAIAFAEKLLLMLDEGRFSSTYKYAVILGLLDLCLEHTDAKGAAPGGRGTEQAAIVRAIQARVIDERA